MRRESIRFADVGKDFFNERGPNGLLGMAFHPKFHENRRYFLKHQVFEEDKIATTVVERTASPDFRSDSGQPSRRLWEDVSATCGLGMSARTGSRRSRSSGAAKITAGMSMKASSRSRIAIERMSRATVGQVDQK